MAKQDVDITKLLKAKLRLDDDSALIARDPRCRALQREIDQVGFQIFNCISDHGFFSWKPVKPYKSLSAVKAADIKTYLDLHGTPDKLVPISSLLLPSTFPVLSSLAFENKFPYGQLDIASLHVASKYRNVDLEKIDFAFGGSTLQMLASKDSSGPYFATRVPGTQTILVAKGKHYVQNYADLGFQFEQFVVGNKKALTKPFLPNFVEHLHIMQVGTFRVLFHAETDAMHEDMPVEVKTSNPRYWGSKVMFQMVSSGSTTLCLGTKVRGSTVTRVELLPLSHVAQNDDVRTLESNIMEGMQSLKAEFDDKGSLQEGIVFRISFQSGKLELVPAISTRSTLLLPPPEVVRELL